jgi:two-component system, chemotaxis family, sensor kinase CheA
MVQDALMTVFVSESADLLAQLEDGLLALEQSPNQRGLLDSIFRAGHTLKGSAGLVNLTEIVGLAHLFENVLDRLRKQELSVDAPLISLLLNGLDLLEQMVERVSKAEPLSDLEGLPQVLEQLGRYASRGAALPLAKLVDEVMPGLPPIDEAAPNEERTYLIELRLAPDVLENGQDPFMLLLELRDLGQLLDVRALLDELPPLERMNPHRLYLAFRVVLHTTRPETAIHEVFVFVRDNAELRVRRVLDRRHFGAAS